MTSLRRVPHEQSIPVQPDPPATMPMIGAINQSDHDTRRNNDPLLDNEPVTIVPIASLLSADSPRIAGECTEHIRTLAELETPAPPIVVHRPTMRVIDGMHRLRAAAERGQRTIEVRFFDGLERDIFALAVELNSSHGLPLSNADRAAAAGRLVSSHQYWSDRAIASLTGLSSKTVAMIRQRATENNPQLNVRLGRDGKFRPLSSAQGRAVASRLIVERPMASLREIAREAGISPSTVRDVRDRVRSGQDPVPSRLLARHQGKRVHTGKRSARQHDCKEGGSVAATAFAVCHRNSSTLRQLKNDPSLRFTELGRMVLQLLNAGTISPDGWASLANSVPAHCAGVIAQTARDNAKALLQFAMLVEERNSK
jgi:AraC-like DNA-binding protein